MRLTADSILREQEIVFSPVMERELRLRNLQIPVVENLGSTRDQFDAFDFSENEILRIDGSCFPTLRRLRTLLLSHNRISSIGPGLGSALPNLETLVLSRNSLARIEDLSGLSELKNLQRLVLLENPVCKLPDYRVRIVGLVPSLRTLDFVKVVERVESIGAVRAEVASGAGEEVVMDKSWILRAIQSSTSVSEIERLEAILQRCDAESQRKGSGAQ
jgi:U2 small nuclear ribonucleoprotein A'